MRGITEYFAELLFENEPHNVVNDYLKRRGWKETPIGRKQVIQWLLHLEQSSQQRDPVLAAYDFGWLWEELGISRFEHPQE